MPTIEALGAERLVTLLTEQIMDRELLDPKMQDSLEESVVEFLARNPLPLATVARTATLVAECPEIVGGLLRRAHALSPTPADRAWLEQLARQCGFRDLFVAEKSKPVAVLTQSQQQGLRRLEAMARLHFAGAFRHGIQLRTNSLIAGPSGVGKTNLVRQLAAKLGLPVLKLTYGDWIVSGARAEPSTMQRLQIALDRHPRLVIHLDELDKFQTSTDPWSRALMGEVFGVLDREPGCAGTVRFPWGPEHAEKLRRDVFIVGSGTWQNLWKTNGGGVVGFGRSQSGCDMPLRIREAGIIPEELMNRFNQDLILLAPYTVEDFREIARQLKLAPAVLDPVEAVASGLNFRRVEAALTTAALRDFESGADSHL